MTKLNIIITEYINRYGKNNNIDNNILNFLQLSFYLVILNEIE